MLVKWIKIPYANPQSWVTNNGFATPFFPLVISVELLASAIRSDKSIKGLSLDSKEFKLVVIKDYESAFDAVTLIQIP